jgi:hypothetical protein
MEHALLHIQARLFQWTGLFWLVTGLVLGKDPLDLIWQAGAVGFVGMLAGGMLLRIAVNHVGNHLAQQLAAELEAAEAAANTSEGAPS